MRKLLFFGISLLVIYPAISQTITQVHEKTTYLTSRTIPDFKVYQAPDSTAFTNEDIQKKKPILFMIFSPDCGHCQHETSVLIENIKHFHNTQILMFTWLPYSDMMAFYKTYKIASYPQITMGWDYKDFFLPYFQVETYPTLIAYDKNGNLVKAFKGEINMEDVWKALGEK